MVGMFCAFHRVVEDKFNRLREDPGKIWGFLDEYKPIKGNPRVLDIDKE